MSGKFSAKNRAFILAEMEQELFDIIIIGGGITGAGIALDAQSRGMKIALVEMQDFAAGTSSRSTKLVHGGLRYLKQLEVGLVAEVGKERKIVYENGPHVTTPIEMLLPFYKGGAFGHLSTSIGLKVYDFLAGVNKSERRRILNEKQTIEKEPLLNKHHLNGSGIYVEYRTDDARLTIEVLKAAVSYGAKAVNYTKVDDFVYKQGKIAGVHVCDQLSGNRFQLLGRKVINAAGPWVDSIRKLDHTIQQKNLYLTKGVHIVFDNKKFPLKQAIYFESPDRRMVFAIPREGKTYVGTTDTVYEGGKENPVVDKKDCEYLLKAIHYQFPSLNLELTDIESSWAGLRPLIYEKGKDPSEISRKDEIWQSKSGLITIAGGKLTGYRKMAEDIVDLVAKQFKDEKYKLFSESASKKIPISGGNLEKSKSFQSFIKNKQKQGIPICLTNDEASFITKKYGSNASKIYKIIKDNEDDIRDKAIPNMLYGIVMYSITEEMTTSPIDFFVRRTGDYYFNKKKICEWKQYVIEIMKSELNWTEEERNSWEREVDGLINKAPFC